MKYVFKVVPLLLVVVFFSFIKTGHAVDLNNFAITAGTYPETADLEKIVEKEFGSNYRITDWNDIVAYHSDGGNAKDFENEFGTAAMITYNGSHWYGSSRHYFYTISHRPGQTPFDGYLSHANINNHEFDLGSWYGLNYHILVYKKNSNRSEPIADLNDGLVAYYPFNGNANDESGNGNNGTVHGAALTEDRCNNSSGAYKFNGTSSYIAVPNTSYLAPSHEITLSVWVKPDAVMNDVSILSNTEYQSSGYELWQNHASSNDPNKVRFVFRSYSSIENVIAYTADYTINKFHLLVATYDKTEGTLKLYVDGVLDTVLENKTHGLVTPTRDLWIGGWASSPTTRHFSGVLDEVRIYNRTLSESEILQLYSEQPCESPDTCSQSSLQAQYEAGKQYCIDNPEACGWTSEGYTQNDLNTAKKESYDEGYKAGKSSCDDSSTQIPSDGCAILEENFDINMPCIDVFGTKLPINLKKFTNPDDPFGYYWKLNLK